jgi:hypothetical protein
MGSIQPPSEVRGSQKALDTWASELRALFRTIKNPICLADRASQVSFESHHEPSSEKLIGGISALTEIEDGYRAARADGGSQGGF